MRTELPRFWLSARGGAELGTMRVLEPRGRGLYATVEVPARALRHPEARLVWAPDGEGPAAPLVTVPLPIPGARGSDVARDLAAGTVSRLGGRWLDDGATKDARPSDGSTTRLRYRLGAATTESAIIVRASVAPDVDRTRPAAGGGRRVIR
jgi:hypothetical protein